MSQFQWLELVNGLSERNSKDSESQWLIKSVSISCVCDVGKVDLCDDVGNMSMVGLCSGWGWGCGDQIMNG